MSAKAFLPFFSSLVFSLFPSISSAAESSCGADVRESGTAVVSDARSLSAALASDNTVILIENDIFVPASIDMGAKKLVGPGYFKNTPSCVALPRPVLSFSAGENFGMNGGEINSLILDFSISDQKTNVISGSGIIQDTDVKTAGAASVFKVFDSLDIKGKITAESSDISSTFISLNENAALNIAGTVVLKGKGSGALSAGRSSKVHILPGGSLTSFITGGYEGISMQGKASFIADGPVKIMEPFYNAIAASPSSPAPKLVLNAANNYLAASNAGVAMTSGTTIFNGTTAINCTKKDNTSCKAISVLETSPSSGMAVVEINAPVTVTGLRKTNRVGTLISSDGMLKMFGGTFHLNSTFKSENGNGFIFLRTRHAEFGPQAALLGSDYIQNMNETQETAVEISAGARMEIGGVCKKAPTNSIMVMPGPGEDNVTNPIAPFTEGC